VFLFRAKREKKWAVLRRHASVSGSFVKIS